MISNKERERRKVQYDLLREIYGRELGNYIAYRWQRCYSKATIRERHPGMCNLWKLDLVAFAEYFKCIDGWDNPQLSIDRINTKKGYEPGNIRCVSILENNRNSRNTVFVEKPDGNKIPFTEFLEIEFGFRTMDSCNRLYGNLKRKLKINQFSYLQLISHARNNPQLWPSKAMYDKYMQEVK